jgi:hypothetical protein
MPQFENKFLSPSKALNPNHARFAFMVAVAVIAFIAVISSWSPIPNERGLPASPLHLAPSSDIEFYLKGAETYFTDASPGFSRIIDSVITGFFQDGEDGSSNFSSMQIAPPVFPLLLKLFDYRQGNTLPLALVFIAISLLISGVWINILWQNGFPRITLIAFIFLPHIAWFTINLGSDLLLALWFALFYRFYMVQGGGSRKLLIGMVIAICAVLTRPTGISLLVFLALDQIAFTWRNNPRSALIILAFFGALAIPLAGTFFPYFLGVLEGANSWPFYGITQTNYLKGIFSSLPAWLDISVSWISLLAAKLFYAFGFRPSYGDTSLILVMVRTAPGIPFLVGFVYLLFKGQTSDKILTSAVFLPILAGPAQDRYLLPIQPVLFLYFCRAIIEYWPGVMRKMTRGAT